MQGFAYFIYFFFFLNKNKSFLIVLNSWVQDHASYPQRPYVAVAAKENGQKQSSCELWAADMQLSFRPMLLWNKAKH